MRLRASGGNCAFNGSGVSKSTVLGDTIRTKAIAQRDNPADLLHSRLISTLGKIRKSVLK